MNYDMDNKKRIYICPQAYRAYTVETGLLNSIAIAINLYYENSSDLYFFYIDNIPKEINVYIISSNELLLEKARKHFAKREYTFYISKKNRGRDISALLVVFREIAKNYKYFCFLHDKKARHRYLENDIKLWNRNLWENMIGSESYVHNIIGMLEKDSGIGLLAPPEPIGEYIYAWYKNAWYQNYDITCDLARKIKLSCNISKDVSPIALGTVFWARTSALEKLLKRDWKYEDFPEEPLPKDGTISHAVERVIEYTVKEAGYRVGSVMTDSYAETLLSLVQDNMRETFKILEETMNIHSVHQLKQMDEQKKQIIRFFSTYEKVYLYGAGVYGCELLELIRKEYRREPEGFIVSDGKRTNADKNGLKIYELSEIEPKEDVGIIISTNYDLQEEMEKELIARGHKNYIMGYR